MNNVSAVPYVTVYNIPVLETIEHASKLLLVITFHVLYDYC